LVRSDELPTQDAFIAFHLVMSENPAQELTVFFFSFFSCVVSRLAAKERM
jgi:hypothetical protein